jgi:hypothetical protein
MKRQKKWKTPKPRLNPNDDRFTTKVVSHKKKKQSKESCRKFNIIDYEDEY